MSGPAGEAIQRLKRTFDSDIAQPVCPSRTSWRLLRHAKDINDTEVEVFQPEHGSNRIKQWFYTVTCNNRSFRSRRDCPGCCIGIAHDRNISSIPILLLGVDIPSSYSENLLIVKGIRQKSLKKFGIGKIGIGIDKFEAELTKWNRVELTKEIDPMSGPS
ncbi:hypothetical protein LSH36_11g13068 [Paralvinella palmiformis]|uniref:Uncharacterized protein n=1 Tax=Paralvinella palmiformis TaxID=53620 RepID=A0AAD9NGF2_9ANNE|nr:hypothetical protein LSH36_11g13068 [Paralvinella palmiformis]